MQDTPRPRTDGAASADDERAIARYLYLLRTAPPEAIEQVHADAFRALTEAQRGELLARIGQVLPPYERGLAVPVNGTPIGLARLITRAEMRQPGTVARLFGAGGAIGSVAVPSLLGGIAGAVAVSAIAAPFLAGAALALGAATASGAPWASQASEASDASDASDAAAPDDAGSALPDGDVADAGPVDDPGFDFDLDDLFDV